MLSPMFGRRRKPKRFNYKFRHHDPAEEERRKRRIRIQRPHKKHHQGRSILVYAVCLSFVVWLIYQLGSGKIEQLLSLFMS